MVEPLQTGFGEEGSGLKTDGGLFSNTLAKIGGQVNVNGEDFWLQWADSGGDAEQYVKESMPNYAITAGLLITMTFPLAVEIPESVVEQSEASAMIFCAFMAFSTVLNIFIIILTLIIYQQFCCTVSKETQKKFCAHFGYLVPLQAMALVLEIVLVLAAMLIAVYSLDFGNELTENRKFEGLLTSVLVALLLQTVYFVYEIPRWNQNQNYIPVMEVRSKNQKLMKGGLPELSELISDSVPSERTEAVLNSLKDAGCLDSVDLLHFMQNFAKNSGDDSLGIYAKPLLNLGVLAFDALRIAEHIGIEAFMHHDRYAGEDTTNHGLISKLDAGGAGR